jgi:SagB-type dehydrogenase family enzyme
MKSQARRTLLLGSAWSLVAASFGCSGKRAQDAAGESFHRATSLSWSGVMGGLFRSRPPRPAQYKTDPGVERIALPEPDFEGLPLERAIARRRSVRRYAPEPLRLRQLSQLLHAAQGITGTAHGQPLRAAPSAGALYPFEIYVIAHRIAELDPGIYHYAVRDHGLEVVATGDFRQRITSAALQQDMLGQADTTFVLAAVFDRSRHKYGERGLRYVYMEAGHISQNISLQAVSLGLGSVGVGAFLDAKVNELIGADGRQEAAIYLHAVGTQ